MEKTSGMELTRITDQPSCSPVSLLWLSRYAEGARTPPPSPPSPCVSSLLNLKSCSLFHAGLWAPIRVFYLSNPADARHPPQPQQAPWPPLCAVSQHAPLNFKQTPQCTAAGPAPNPGFEVGILCLAHANVILVAFDGT